MLSAVHGCCITAETRAPRREWCSGPDERTMTTEGVSFAKARGMMVLAFNGARFESGRGASTTALADRHPRGVGSSMVERAGSMICVVNEVPLVEGAHLQRRPPASNQLS